MPWWPWRAATRLDLGCELDLGHALEHAATRPRSPGAACSPASRMRSSSHGALPARRPPDQAGEQSARSRPWKPLRIVEVARRRQHVELEAEAPPPTPARPTPRRIPQRAERLDALRGGDSAARRRSCGQEGTGSPSPVRRGAALCVVPVRKCRSTDWTRTARVELVVSMASRKARQARFTSVSRDDGSRSILLAP